MLNKYILSLSDNNKDSKIHIEEHNNEDKIRFITEGQQRMIISNSTTSGNIGIGLNFNNPTSTLDIQGDLAVSNKIGIGTSTVETSLDINSSLKVFDVLNNVSGYVNTSDGDYMKLQATSRTDTSTKKNIILNPDGGNVGIGIDNPQVKLDVDGRTRINSNNLTIESSGVNNYDHTTLNIIQKTSMSNNTNNAAIIGLINEGDNTMFTIGHNHGNLEVSYKNSSNTWYNPITLSSSTYIGIGTSNPRKPLDVQGVWPQIVAGARGSGNTAVMGTVSSNNVEFGGHNFALNAWSTAKFNGTHFNSPSDKRIKENIVNADLNILYNKFKQLNLRQFTYKDGYTGLEDSSMQDIQVGWIAQEVEEIFPKCVNKENMNWGFGEMQDFRTIDKTRLSDYTCGVLKRAIEKIDVLETQLANVLTRLSALENN